MLQKKDAQESRRRMAVYPKHNVRTSDVSSKVLGLARQHRLESWVLRPSTVWWSWSSSQEAKPPSRSLSDIAFVTRRRRCGQMQGRRSGKTGGVFAGIHWGFFRAEHDADGCGSFAAV